MNLDQLTKNLIATSPDVAAKVEAAVEVEAEKIDRRAITSAQNGQSGGRPFLRTEALAEDFLRENYTRDDVLTLRRYCGRWYEWRGDYWHERVDGDIRAALAGHLQARGVGEVTRLSRRTVDDVVAMLDSDRLCALDSLKYRIPCFLPNGEGATGWMPTKNVVINVEVVAKAMERGEPIPPKAVRAPSPDLFVTYGLDYEFDPDAQCPKFLKYLSEVQPSEENRECLQMLAGLALVPDCSVNVAFFLYGEAGTGKSVFVNVLAHLVGTDNCCSVPLASLAARFGKAPLTEKLLNIVGDLPTMPESGKTNGVEGFFKQITAGEEIPVERKGVDAYKAPVIARMVFATNSMPYFADRSRGVWDRVRLIPFNQRIRGTEGQNPNLAVELRDELPGLLNWALVGLAKLRKLTQFPECPEGAALKDEHRNACDHELEFLTERVEAADEGSVSSQWLYEQYRVWVRENGYHPVGAGNFKNAVKRVFPKSYEKRERVGTHQITFFCNIRNISDLKFGVQAVQTAYTPL